MLLFAWRTLYSAFFSQNSFVLLCCVFCSLTPPSFRSSKKPNDWNNISRVPYDMGEFRRLLCLRNEYLVDDFRLCVLCYHIVYSTAVCLYYRPFFFSLLFLQTPLTAALYYTILVPNPSQLLNHLLVASACFWLFCVGVCVCTENLSSTSNKQKKYESQEEEEDLESRETNAFGCCYLAAKKKDTDTRWIE